MWGRKEKEKKWKGARKSSRVTFKGNLRKDTICGSGLRREAEPTLGGVSAYAGSQDAAAGAVLGWESCACQAWGQLQHGLREGPSLGTE